MHVRKDDMVEVIAGDDAEKGVPRRVLRTLPDVDKVVVEGVNLVYKHLKPNRRNMQGGRLSKEMPIAVSNVLLFCPHCRRGRKIGYKYAADGRKSRVCRKCKSDLGQLSKPRKAYAQKGS